MFIRLLSADFSMDLRVVILRKLFRHRIIGGKHSDIENLSKGIPAHLRGQAKEVARMMIKESLLLAKSTFYGVDVSLNPERIDEVIYLLEKSDSDNKD
jgi:hypothetical protein